MKIEALILAVFVGAFSGLTSPVIAGSAAISPQAVPRAVAVARTTKLPGCTIHVDTAFAGTGNGTAAKPFKTIAAGVAAAKNGSVICVAQGTYAEQITPGAVGFTLAGGFATNKAFKVRNSALYVSKASGNGGSFVRIVDPGPSGTQKTAIDGFEITGYAQAIVRDIYYSQRFDITNNYIHDNNCNDTSISGAGFALNNVSGTIRGNVFLRNICGRGGAGSLNDSTNENSVSFISNRIEANAGNEPVISHGGALYFFVNKLAVTGNSFVGNSATGWGGGLYVGAFTEGGQQTTAKLAFNTYRANKAGNAGGGFFCDDGAHCLSDHEIYDRNCGGNIFLDGGPTGGDATVARFDHLTNVNARTVGCSKPGAGVVIDKNNPAPDNYTFTNAIFFGNASKSDFATSCGSDCNAPKTTVTYSMVQKAYANGGVKVTFGAGIVTPRNPRFVAPAKGDFHLMSTFGHFTPKGYVKDAVSSPALAKGDPAGSTAKNPKRAGKRTELGAYGNSAEASYVR